MKKIFYALSLTAAICMPAKAQHWQIIDSVNNANFINIHFWNAKDGILSGEMQGRFLKTHDGGLTWDTIQVPFLDATNGGLKDVKFVNGNYGFACGGSGFSTIQSMLIGTKNGGQTWDSLVINFPGAYEFTGIDFNAANNAIKGIVFGSALYKTLDSGKTLSTVNLPSMPFYIYDALLSDTKIILAGGSSVANKIYTSTNWGTNWTLAFDDNTIGVSSLDISGSVVVGACSNGWVLISTDAGNNWTKKKIASDSTNFSKAKFGINGYIYLAANAEKTYIYGSSDNGATWQKQQVDMAYQWLWDITMPTKDTGYTISNRRLYKTTTGGGLGLSVTDITPKDKIRLYPNPAHDVLYIETAPGIKITAVCIYNIAGKLVSKSRNDVKQIDVSTLAKGEYIIEINAGVTSSKKKLVVY